MLSLSNPPPAPRPCFDVVDEYVRGVEEWREKRHPGDAELRRVCVSCVHLPCLAPPILIPIFPIHQVVLDVATFLLEFALQGHEAAADVPACYVHPPLPPEDLKALGLPYLTVHPEGHATLVQPVLPSSSSSPDTTSAALGFKGNGTGGGSSSGGEIGNGTAKPLAAELEGPAVTTYYFNRWMWTQFPLVALANCATADGSAGAAAALDHLPSSSSSPSLSSSSAEQQQPYPQHEQPQLLQAPGSPRRKAFPASLVKIATLPLPQIVVRNKPTRAREGLVGLAEEGLLGSTAGPAPAAAGGGVPGLGDKEQVRACVRLSVCPWIGYMERRG